MFNLKKIGLMFLSFLFVGVFGFFGKQYFTSCHKIDFKSAYVINPTKPNVLVLYMHKGFSGSQVAALAQYKNLLNAGYPVHFLVSKNSYSDKELTALKLSHYVCAFQRRISENYSYLFGFAKNIRAICLKEKIDIIHCNHGYEVFGVCDAVKDLPIKVVVTRHEQEDFPLEVLKKIDGAIGVSEVTARRMTQLNQDHALRIQKIAWIPAFWEYEKFANFVPSTQTREAYFKEHYNITFQTPFVVINVAGLLPYKNQQFLLHALKKMIELNKPMDVLLVGSGGQKAKLKKCAHDLGISKYVHFAGFVKEVAPLISYADAMALVSTTEAFPLVLVEGATCKKPLIGVARTGMENMIKHGTTGLLVEQGDTQGLANALEFLYDNPFIGKHLGAGAYDFVQKNYSTQSIFFKLEQFYDELLNTPTKLK